MNQVVFSTDAVHGPLQFTVIAIEVENLERITGLIQLGTLLFDQSGSSAAAAGEFSPQLLDALGGENDPVGYYSTVWTSRDDWGAGNYISVGEQDLMLSFDVEVNGKVGSRIVRGNGLEPSPTAMASPTPTLPGPPPTGTSLPASAPTRPVPVPSPFPSATPTASIPTPYPTATSVALPPTATSAAVPPTATVSVPTATPIAPPTATLAAPVVTNLSWLDTNDDVITEIGRGMSVRLVVDGIGPLPASSEVVIYEVDPGSPDDPVATVTMNLSGSAGTWHGEAEWSTFWVPDGAFGFGGDPEYKFVVLGVDSPELSVR